VFVSRHGSEGDELRVVDLATGAVTPAMRAKASIGFPLFHGNDNLTYLFGPESPGKPRVTREVGARGGVDKDLPLPTGGGWLVSDWSPDSNFALTVGARAGRSVCLVDRRASGAAIILEDPERILGQAKFSNDGQWITFMAVEGAHTRLYIVPFRQEPTPVSEWIALTDGSRWDDKPRLSADNRLLFFVSDRDGYRCIWVQPLAADKRPRGTPRPVFHFHSPRRGLVQEDLGDLELGVGRGTLVFNQGETTGNVWLLDPNRREP
jgi:Tol biopolymer transport system component